MCLQEVSGKVSTGISALTRAGRCRLTGSPGCWSDLDAKKLSPEPIGHDFRDEILIEFRVVLVPEIEEAIDLSEQQHGFDMGLVPCGTACVDQYSLKDGEIRPCCWIATC